MTATTDIVTFLDELLEPSTWDDYGPNGLQVPGAAETWRVATGVSAQLELFRRAAEAGADLLLTHHGLFWDFHPRALSPQMKARLEALFGAGIALAAYHLPLDAHPEVGNNALICQALGFERAEPFGKARDRSVGFVGRSAEGIGAAELVARCGKVFGQEPLVFDAGPEVVHSIGVVSGAGASSVSEAAAAGLDAFLTGEPAEHVMADAREAGVHFIAAGHYATETLGIRRVGELVAERFGVEHVFIDVPNPV
ncbi:MAG: Nif3-like dinuclear metal center hexameric protein [Thermoleophilaceae bacterium]